MKTVTLLLITDQHGRIIGASKKQTNMAESSTTSAGIKPLPEQIIHEIEIAEDQVNWHKTPEMYEWARRHYVKLTNQKPELRPIMELLEKAPNFSHKLHTVTNLPETHQEK